MDSDETWFTRLYVENSGRVFDYFARRVGSDAASDLASETFLTAWRRGIRPPMESELPWLYGIARRTLANELRANGRRQALTARLSHHESREASASPAADSSIGALDVRRAIRCLNDADAEALMLTGWEELSPAEAATVMECSPAAFRVRLFRARKHLRQALDGVQAARGKDPGSEPQPRLSTTRGA